MPHITVVIGAEGCDRLGGRGWSVLAQVAENRPGVNEADRTDRTQPGATGRPAGSIGGDWRSNPRDSPILPALPAFF